MRVAVVGGGLAGLTTAYRLTVSDPTLEVVIFESSARVGGAIRTVEVGGLELPAGADGVWARKPWAVELCAELGLEVVAPATSGIWLWTDAGLVVYPTGTAFGIPGDPGDVLRWPGLSRAGRRRALADLLKSKRKDEGDQTLGSMLRRRLGDEATDLAVGPILSAPFLGDVDRMSLRATYPELERFESSQGSLIRGAQAANRVMRKGPDPGPIMVRPRGGVEAIVRVLAARLGPRVRTEAPVVRLSQRGSGWRVDTAVASVDAVAVVLATPADTGRQLAALVAREAVADLESLHTDSALTVLLVYPPDSAAALPPGTGIVVPRGKAPMRACTWLSSRWAEPSFDTRAVISCSLGGEGDDDVLEAGDDEIVEACARHLAAVLPLPERPADAAVVRWPGALPRYELGHVERVARIREHLPPGIFVVGQAYEGVDVPDVVHAAGQVAETVTTYVARRTEASRIEESRR